MKRLMKWVALTLGTAATVAAVALLTFWGVYRSVVGPTPGGLATGVEPGEYGRRVNLFIGTGGVPWMCGHNTPAATTPFGMVRLGPDTASLLINRTGQNRSGYFYGDNKIIGFSHTRLVGADALEGGLFRVFPTVASKAAAARKPDRFARFSHRHETAFPGYYAVRLPREGVLSELTATPRVGVHRYTFDDSNDAPRILIDVTSALGTRRCEDGRVRILPDAREVEGSARAFGSFSSRYGGLDAYFVARFSEPFTGFGTWSDGRYADGIEEGAGNDAGAQLAFAPRTGGSPVELRLAISYVSVANARENLEAEAAGKTFEEVAAEARDAWEDRLAAISIEGGTDRQRTIFYTAVYRAFQMPTLFHDVNGEYTGFDKAVHRAEGFRYYTDMSLWDTFRTVHPLYTLVAPEDQRDMMVSLVEMAKAGACLPRWPSGAGYTNCMLGTPADIAVAEAYLKGIRDFDIETAYAAMRRTGLTGKPEGTRFAGREGLEWYVRLGYCPSDRMRRSVSSTLEYAHADHAISLLARELGKEDDAARFAKQAQSYRNVWNPETLYFEERDSEGRFPEERDPLALSYTDTKGRYTRGYVEGSGLQWRWYAPHDPQGLIALFPSPECFVEELDRFFAGSRRSLGHWHPGVYYWHGNEPDIHAAYLFNEAGRPDLTRKWVRWILEHRYDDHYAGLDGNDDAGTLSAWYVFSALGFYPVPGTTRYELGAPLFARAEVRMGGGRRLIVVADGYGPGNSRVERVELNGTPLDRTWFTHDAIAGGGTLRFTMAPEPQ